MGAIFGSTDRGYRPKDQAQQLGDELLGMVGSGGVPQVQSGYESTSKTNTPGGFRSIEDYIEQVRQHKGVEAGNKWLEEQGYLQKTYIDDPTAYKPEFTTGESGVDMSSGYTPQGFDAFQFTAPQLEDKVTPYYSGIESQAIEGAKMGAQTGMEQALAATGRRGLSPRGGIAGRNLGGVAQGLSRDVAGIRRDIGMKRAGALQGLAERQAAYDMQRQQSQAGQNLAAAQFGAQQQQFGAGQLMREKLAQAQMDAAYRAERIGYQRQPMEDKMRLYGAMGSLGSRDVKKPGLLGGAGQLGQAAYGLGTGISAFG